ncbi:CYTH domain-containing protein [Bacillus sp. PS06]|uniref:CYTH domain-containing protein n=1 Tax=Bacillus sp. PS06 TaxID=2764176 RepID=UPI0017803464|nr:CYTH domain-containing protein [Bacillus sp. PS06]MBD8067510.1 CYTH domain-containing protein [Bacillus sp. PS06]
MTQELEIEYKNLLTIDEFHSVMKFLNLSPSDFLTQKNHYFDTPDFSLKNRQSALRIREKQNKFTLTLKQPQSIGLLETHQSLTKDQASSLINGATNIQDQIAVIIDDLGINPSELQYFGTLETSRAEVPYKNGLLVLDHSFYLSVEDFELEYEVEDAEVGLKDFHEFLTQLHIPIRHTKNKIQRLYHQLNHK